MRALRSARKDGHILKSASGSTVVHFMLKLLKHLLAVHISSWFTLHTAVRSDALVQPYLLHIRTDGLAASEIAVAWLSCCWTICAGEANAGCYTPLKYFAYCMTWAWPTHTVYELVWTNKTHSIRFHLKRIEAILVNQLKIYVPLNGPPYFISTYYFSQMKFGRVPSCTRLSSRNFIFHLYCIRFYFIFILLLLHIFCVRNRKQKLNYILFAPCCHLWFIIFNFFSFHKVQQFSLPDLIVYQWEEKKHCVCVNECVVDECIEMMWSMCRLFSWIVSNRSIEIERLLIPRLLH